MKKSEILELLSEIKEMGCCNMLDRNCLYQTLKAAGELKAAKYLKSLTSSEFIVLLSKDLSNYLKTSPKV